MRRHPHLCRRPQVEHAARLLLEGGYKIDVCYTSRLKRAIRSTWILLQELDLIHLPVYKTWRLNERMYGALQGRSKPGVAAERGEALVQARPSRAPPSCFLSSFFRLLLLLLCAPVVVPAAAVARRVSFSLPSSSQLSGFCPVVRDGSCVCGGQLPDDVTPRDDAPLSPALARRGAPAGVAARADDPAAADEPLAPTLAGPPAAVRRPDRRRDPAHRVARRLHGAHAARRRAARLPGARAVWFLGSVRFGSVRFGLVVRAPVE